MRSLPWAGEIGFHLGKRAFALEVNLKTNFSGLTIPLPLFLEKGNAAQED